MNIVWYSEIKWDYLKTRKQHLLSYFPETDRVLFFQPFSFRGKNPFFVRRDKNITFITLPVYRPSSKEWINKTLTHIVVRKVLYTLLALWEKLVIKIVFNQPPDRYVFSNLFALPLLGKKVNCSWDYNDDPEQFGPQPKWATSLLSEFLADPNTNVIACSSHLKTKLEKTYSRSVHHIPNGVSLTDFSSQTSSLKLTDRKVLGYIGIISPWFFDFDLIKKIANAHPDFEIKLYGPVDRNAQKDLDKLSTISNLNWSASIPYSEIPATMNTFRVGLVPLKSIPQVWQAASAKFLQYLAAGIPVVSTHMDQFVGLSQRAYMCKSHTEMLTGLENALTVDKLETLPALSQYDWPYLSRHFRDIIEASK